MAVDTNSSVAGRRLRILEVETFGRGGLIHYAYNLSCALAQRGHEVFLVTTARYELADRELPANVRLVKKLAPFTGRFGKTLPAFVLQLGLKIEAVADAVRLMVLARRLRPDVIHFHSTNHSALAYLQLLRLVRCPVATTAHQVMPHEPVRFQRAISGRIHRLGHLVIAHSKVDRERLVSEFGLEHERVVVIPHGEYGFFDSGGERVDRDAARAGLDLGPEHEVALFFGYIREYKGLDLLLEAWSTVVESRPNARLVIAGDPGQLGASKLRELDLWAQRLGAVRRFDYIPFGEVARYFAAADALVLPYRRIGQSGVLFLGLSLGLPVVASSVGGFPETLRDGESALLVAPESPGELAQALIRVLGDRELRRHLALGGQVVADQHSWGSIAERTESAFNRMVES
jgi:glycosyltransferase involved in cell wall biosynthesis